jgi:hypothetical protein
MAVLPGAVPTYTDHALVHEIEDLPVEFTSAGA